MARRAALEAFDSGTIRSIQTRAAVPTLAFVTQGCVSTRRRLTLRSRVSKAADGFRPRSLPAIGLSKRLSIG